MSISTMLEVFIGLFFIFFILSTVASNINELIGGLLQRRARTMADFIVGVLTPLATKDTPDPTATFYETSPIKPLKEKNWFEGGIDMLSDLIYGKPKVDASRDVPSISNANFAQGVLQVIGFTQSAYDKADTAMAELKTLVDGLPEGSQLKTTLTSAINQADGKITNVTTSLEAWFDGQMSKLSDIYKQRTRLILFIIGLIIAVVLNIDTLAIANALATNPTLRQAVISQANSLVQSTDPNAQEVTLTCNGTSYSSKDAQAAINYTQCELNALSLPVNWPNGFLVFGAEPLQQIFGIIITALATSLGAPFWYDLLKSLTGK